MVALKTNRIVKAVKFEYYKGINQFACSPVKMFLE